MGFKLVATGGTARFLADQGLEVRTINKVLEGRPHIVDEIKNGEVQLVFNTTEGAQALADLDVAPPRGADDEGALLHDRGGRPGRRGGHRRHPQGTTGGRLAPVLYLKPANRI